MGVTATKCSTGNTQYVEGSETPILWPHEAEVVWEKDIIVEIRNQIYDER